jgi:hypothetical protein
MLGMVYMSVHQKVDLVSADYYEKEIRFQGKIDGLKNTSALAVGFTFEILSNKVILHYPISLPRKLISGEIYFYRPSDSAMDEKFTAKPDTNNIQMFQLKNPKRGLYKLLCDLEADGKKYYYEESIQLN